MVWIIFNIGPDLTFFNSQIERTGPPFETLRPLPVPLCLRNEVIVVIIATPEKSEGGGGRNIKNTLTVMFIRGTNNLTSNADILEDN